MKRMIYFLILVILFFCTWEAVARYDQDMIFVLPPPSQVLLRLIHFPLPFLFHTLITLREMAAGFVIALIAAFPLGWLIAHRELPRLTLQPLFVVIQCIPMFTLAPLMILWFDWSSTAIIIPTALMIFFPLTLNIYQGLRSTPDNLREFFRVNHASAWMTFLKLEIPWALPHLFAGLRISAAIAGIGAIAGEWAGAQYGLGVFMQESRRNVDLEGAFGGLFCLALISLLFYGSILLIEYLVKRPRIVKASPLLLLLPLLLSLTSCQKQEQQNPPTRLILDWLPNPNHIPLYAGIEKGIYEKHGINLQILKLQDPAVTIPHLTSRQTDLAVYYMPHTIRAATKGAQFKVIGVLIKEPLNVLLFRADSAIKDPGDLNGKTIGYSQSPGVLGTAYLQSLRDHFGANIMELRNLNFDLVAALGTKKIDATFEAYWNIEPVQLESLGVKTEFLKLTDMNIPPYYELVILAGEHLLARDPSFGGRFRKALEESISFAKQNPEEALELYLKANPDKGPSTRTWEKKAWNLTHPILVPSQKMDAALWNNFQRWMVDHQVIDKQISIEEILDED